MKGILYEQALQVTQMHEFLKKIGVIEETGGALRFGDDSAIGQEGICPLPQRQWLTIQGPDAATFMQGQFTCDLNEINAAQSQLGAHCTPKGRMIGSFRLVMRAENDYLLALPADNSEQLLAHIKKYIVFSKAEANLLENSYVAFGLSGPLASSTVEAYFGDCPSADNAQLISEQGICLKLPGQSPRFEVWLEPAEAEKFWQQYSETIDVISNADWLLEDIRSGLVEIHAATADELIPQSIGLQHFGGVSFSKGCYTGQEIVARTHYLGKLKQQLFHFTGETSAPAVGSSIEVRDSGQTAGLVVAAVNTAATGCEGLAVINHKISAEVLVLAATERSELAVKPIFETED